MQIHELRPKHKNKGKKRVGRGGRKGTYSGKGNKGQKSRAGRKMVPIIRELIKRYPKLKGYRSFVLEDYSAIVNLETLEKTSKDGETTAKHQKPQKMRLKKPAGLLKNNRYFELGNGLKRF